MPAKTAVPSVRRISAPAPCEITSGNTPRMKANEVMMIGRNRTRGGFHGGVEQRRPFLLPVAGKFDDQNRVLARQSDQHDEADLHENIDVHPGHRHAGQALDRHIGTTRITASGSDQLSYKPDSTKNTRITPSTKALNGFCCKSRNDSILLDCFCK